MHIKPEKYEAIVQTLVWLFWEQIWAFLKTGLWHWFFHIFSFLPLAVPSLITIIYSSLIIATMIRIFCCLIPSEHEKERRMPMTFLRLLTLVEGGRRREVGFGGGWTVFDKMLFNMELSYERWKWGWAGVPRNVGLQMTSQWREWAETLG